MNEIFRLAGTIAISNGQANEAIEDTTNRASSASNKLGKIFSKVGSFALNAAKVAGTAAVAAAGAVATGVAAMTKSAVENYAQYEQLVGGVETLFKDSADKVIEYANQAYKTAGMSANTYMETVTSFSASLLQSLDGDTAKATESANRAIIDMSDNANKMGTDIGMIMNAYQGFAKQNYTMLDNLKLGYGGTKEEMERLLEDAEKLSGVKYDISSYDDIIQAIHVIQDEMDISGLSAEEAAEMVAKGLMTEEEAFEAMGTTAKEASSTIQGSIGQMKGAWENFMTGMADPNQDFDALVNNLIDSVVTVADNLVPRITKTLPRIISGISSVLQKLSPYIPELFSTLLPAAISAVSSLFSELGKSLPTIFKTLLTSIFGDISNSPIVKMFGKLVDLLKSKGGNIAEIFSSIKTAIAPVIEWLQFGAEGTMKNYSRIFESLLPLLGLGIDIFTKLAKTIIDSVSPTIESFSLVCSDFFSEFTTEILDIVLPVLEDFISMLQDLFVENQDKFAKIGEIFELLFTRIAEIVMVCLEVMKTYLIPFFGWLFNFISENFDTIKAIFQSALDFIGSIFDLLIALLNGEGVWEALVSVFAKFGEMVKNTLKLALDFVLATFEVIKPKAEEIFDKIKDSIVNKIESAKDAVKKIIDNIKGFFNFEVILPKIKLPHFNIDPAGWQIGDLLKGITPTLGIDWYAKAMDNPMIMNKPTAFGINSSGQIMAGGEKGSEVVSGTSTLMNMISDAVASNGIDYDRMTQCFIKALQTVAPELRSNVTVEGDAKGMFKTIQKQAKVFKDTTGQEAFA